MGELVVNMFTSLDGVLQGPGEPDEDREGGFEYGGWQAPYFDEESGKVIGDHIAGLEALLLGRKTYEIFAGYWPYYDEADSAGSIAKLFNRIKKYVVSRSGDPVEWMNSELLQGDAVETVRDLKARTEGNLVILGSAELVHALLPAGLIDAMLLTIHPLVLGSGKRLYPDAFARFTLVESKPTVYCPAHKPRKW